ncbi:HD domain-containing protein [Streptomyces decoyicus]|uniref:HD domain-containing protein n=1 Tax=Streptomyces decoyicus TaxID=249567 RepID=A0ABZ1FTC1_9ACTN|nr:HD domain-containing protein [Streptomyces decoyicus]WSB73144.1 HD domain-containing protein [Streptomyces decoyicus]
MDDQKDHSSPQGSVAAAAGPVPTNVMGLSPVFTDPLWRISVRLNPVEVDLLRTAPLRRLHFVAHGGASTLSTLQSYSRLEHTLGVLALVAHFRPEDQLLRVAALLHDVGHLPLSHTLEGISGLDHHALGLQLLRTEPLRPALEKHGISAEAVIAALGVQPPSPLTHRSGLLNLDHLDSYVRSGRAAGRLDTDPAVILGRLDLKEAAVSADRATAASLVGLVCAEARLHTSWDNVGPVSAVRRLACRLLDHTTLDPDRLARMTDPQLWSAFDSCAATRAESAMIRYELHRLRVTAGGAPGDSSGWAFSLRKIYRSAPLVEGQRIEVSAPELAAELDALRALPTTFRVRWS